MARGFRKPSEAAVPRIGKLAKLPLFFDLRGKRALVAGNTPAVAWKAELLAAAGAAVQVYAAEPCAELQNLADTVHLIRRCWEEDDLFGAAIAVLATEDPDEAKRFQQISRAVGAICSVIDKPVFCDAQFGAIVNRSPVVVGISTDGAAPVLAQSIRRRIETVLPASLVAWAKLAQAIRHRVIAVIPDASRRRLFWERFADLAFTRPATRTPDEIITTAMQMPSHSGSVTLVGAGPGDAELLTLKAMRALQAADVVLFDDLVSDDVLELARREAKRMLVGKRGNGPSCKQEEINELMIKLARQGKRVVRLKGGDPMIFGRAGEEIAALEAAGIPASVVPGITAAAAAAASLGVSLTHRHAAHSVRFVTGHSRDGALPDDLDWKGLADSETTLVFYMAGRTGPAAAQRLMAEGLSPGTPVAIMAAVSRPNEGRWLGRLDQVGIGLDQIGQDRPVLLGIGAVFAQAREEAMSGDPVWAATA
jgi:uroporphyrin-III C-methyltransferase